MREISEFEIKLIQGLKNRHHSAAVHIRDLEESTIPRIACEEELAKYRFLVDEIQKIFDEAKT